MSEPKLSSIIESSWAAVLSLLLTASIAWVLPRWLLTASIAWALPRFGILLALATVGAALWEQFGRKPMEATGKSDGMLGLLVFEKILVPSTFGAPSWELYG